jgi:hypothetical protein
MLTTDLLSNPSDFRWIRSPRGHSYASPFLLQHEGQVWMFFEDYHYEEKRKRINCIPLEADLSTGTSTVCLDLPYHLSYPMVFDHEGVVFMIPTSEEHESIELWRATNFPFSWKLETILFSGPAVRTTPICHGDRWYFFTTLSEPTGNPAFGALFSAASLTAKWVHHPSSPISTDVRETRSAGAIQKVENRLLRVVQDSCENYGSRIHVEEILELTPEAYMGRRVHSIAPDWGRGLRGVRTYGLCASIEAMDAMTFEELR